MNNDTISTLAGQVIAHRVSLSLIRKDISLLRGRMAAHLKRSGLDHTFTILSEVRDHQQETMASLEKALREAEGLLLEACQGDASLVKEWVGEG